MKDLDNSPPRRPRELLKEWVDDFLAEGHQVAGNIRVLTQDDAEDRDTGLVIVDLKNAAATIYMEPVGFDDVQWAATLSARQDDLTLSPHELATLAAEVVVAGNLCSYLQWRSLEWDRSSGLRGGAFEQLTRCRRPVCPQTADT